MYNKARLCYNCLISFRHHFPFASASLSTNLQLNSYLLLHYFSTLIADYTLFLILYDNAYLPLQKLVVSAARQLSFLLWKVNKPILWEHVLDEMYHAALNLNLRLIYEQEQKEVCKNGIFFFFLIGYFYVDVFFLWFNSPLELMLFSTFPW